MKRYWLRIALGASCVFALGMVIVAAGREGVDHVKQLAMNQSVTLPGNMAPFQIDDRRLGSLTGIQTHTPEGRDFPLVNLTVQLDDPSAVGDLEDCVLVARGSDRYRPQSSLRCAPSDSMGDSLVAMGTVTFQPGGEVIQIFVPAGELAGKNWFRSAEAAPAVNRVTQGAGGINIEADSNGAFMLIRDARGQPIFQLNADSTGAFIEINDSNGNKVVRFRAESQGVTGGVH